MRQQALMTPTVHDTKLRPLFIFGTRPELIKLAPVIRECVRRTADIHAVVCATGQHAEVTRSAQADFGIAVDYELRVMRRGQSLVSLLSKCLRRVDRVIAAQQPDCVVAQGDTASVLVAAMAAFMRRVPLIHIEAGLRTHDMAAPWPEEWIRRVASLSTTIHCAPTVQAADNLRAEGIPASNVHVTGNTIVDALQWTLSRCPIPKSPAVLSLSPLVLITAHRRENWGFPLARICRAVAAAAAKYPQVSFVFPVHPNPRVRTVVERALCRLDNVQLLAPLCHADFVSLLARSSLVLTDSGGVQEEACSLGKPNCNAPVGLIPLKTI